jgi:NMD protein affecting ribosome stability and mRNA decay
VDSSVKKDLTVRICELCENYHSSIMWFVDAVLQVLLLYNSNSYASCYSKTSSSSSSEDDLSGNTTASLNANQFSHTSTSQSTSISSYAVNNTVGVLISHVSSQTSVSSVFFIIFN